MPTRTRERHPFPASRLALLLTACLMLLVRSPAHAATPDEISLAGSWSLALDPDDRGLNENWARDPVLPEHITLPGSLQEQGFGEVPTLESTWTTGIARGLLEDPRYEQYTAGDDFTSPFWLTPKRLYVGAAWYARSVEIPRDWAGRRVELVLERPHWGTTVFLNGAQVGPAQDALGTAHVHDLTEALAAAPASGTHSITIRVDNRVIVPVGFDAHAVSDQTQSNWNGIAGEITLRSTPRVWIDSVQVYPNVSDHSIEAVVTIGNVTGEPGEGQLALDVSTRSGRPFRAPPKRHAVSWTGSGTTEVRVRIDLGESAPRWSEFEPTVLELRTTLGEHTSTAAFGLREITIDRDQHGSFFRINGQRVFLRGTLDCATFPETGYPPTDPDSWNAVFRVVKAYGLNHIRFHSWCPPKAAFEAADQLGIYLMPECSTWPNFKGATGLPEWLEAEGDRMRRHYGNHPSFVLMGVGNEFWDGGKLTDSAPMVEPTIDRWREQDPRRFYTTGAGWPLAPANDFHVSQEPRLQLYPGLRLTDPPRTDLDYTAYVSGQSVPVLTHEIGQWCAYPDLSATSRSDAFLDARYLDIYEDSLERAGLGHLAHAFTEASGQFQTLLYKAEIEATLRTPSLAGFQLLGLPDFPGQGFAPVGVIDHNWRPKGYCSPSEYRRFCNDRVLLARLPSRVFEAGSTAEIALELANYGGAELTGTVDWEARGSASGRLAHGSEPFKAADAALSGIAELRLALPNTETAEEVSIRASIRGTAIENDWSLWVFPPTKSTAATPDSVLVVRSIDADVAQRLSDGARVVVLAPPAWIDADTFGSFRPIFWNTVLFSSQREHTLGAMIDHDHPAMAGFPTDTHADWQWWDIMMNSKPIPLDSLSTPIDPIVRPIDDWVDPRSLGLIFEARVGKGRLLVCAVDLETDMQTRPAARALRESLLEYASGRDFDPRQRLEAWELLRLFRAPSPMQQLNAAATASSSQSGYGPELAIDGNPATFWHTAWSPSKTEPPHRLEIDLGRPRDVSGLRYTPRPDGSNGRFGRYRVEVSEAGYTWAEVAAGEWDDGAATRTIEWDTRDARYVRLTMLESANGQAFASAAEVEVILEESR